MHWIEVDVLPVTGIHVAEHGQQAALYVKAQDSPVERQSQVAGEEIVLPCSCACFCCGIDAVFVALIRLLRKGGR